MSGNGMFTIPVAIVSFAQDALVGDNRGEAEQLLPVISKAVGDVGLSTQDMGFVVSGSTDYLMGRPFSFVAALDAVGPWPPLTESHVEMDAAWALYEAVLRLQHGDIDAALVYGFGTQSMSDVPRTTALQLDPYALAPLWPDAHAINGLQARAALDAGVTTQAEVDAILERTLRDGASNPHAVRQESPDAVAGRDLTMAPLSELDVPPVTDGAAAMVVCTLERARQLVARPVQITGMDHRIEAHALGLRDLATSTSTKQAAEAAGVRGDEDLAELHVLATHQEPILRNALGLGESTRINPSGGPLVSNVLMAAGLVRHGEAAARLMAGDGNRAVAHAQSGPAMQQNLVSVLEVAQ